MTLALPDGVIAHSPGHRPVYVHRHTVSFEETNVMGNVYFANYVVWQGHCRELFLREHAPDVLTEIHQGLRLVTIRTSCEYFDEVLAFDEIEIRMKLGFLRGNRLGLEFDYNVVRTSNPGSVAHGAQEIACMKLSGERLVPAEWPASLRAALRHY